MTATQVLWLVFNSDVRLQVVSELITAMLWERQLLGTSYKQDREVIAIHIAKVAGYVAKSIGLLRDMGRLAK